MKRRDLILSLPFLSACAQARPVVGSKNFTEQLILGEILLQHLENRLRRDIGDKLDLGGTFLTHQAILSGGIDLYAEYTGTALVSVLKQPVVNDPALALRRVRAGYARWNMRWMDPLGFENTFAMAVRRDDAERRSIKTLSDAARAQSWRMGVGYEFEERPDGLPGLVKTYGLKLNGSVKTMDLGLLYRALAQRQVDMVAGNSTDGALSVLPIVPLIDDKRFFPPYQAAIVVREAALARYSGLESALQELSGEFADDLMRKLNHAVDGEHRPAPEVAAEALNAIFAKARGASRP